SLFVTDHAGTLTTNSLISAVTDHYDALPNYDAASEKLRPLLTDWLGPGPLSVLTILDHNGQPFEDNALVVAPMRTTAPDTLAQSLVHSLSHAWFRSSHIWLDEGVPQFLSLLWMEQTQGREVTVAHLQEEAKALALAEPAAVRDANPLPTGQSLIAASDEIYYRTKAAAVLEMLRSIVGEDALKHALKLYRDDKDDKDDKHDADPKEFQRVLEQASRRDLNWFFDDWVYRDRGLPDLTIANITPRPLEQIGDKGSGYLVSIEVRNDGDAAAEVPVTLRSGTLTVTQRLRIAARSSASTRIVFAGTPTEVVVNDGTVPETASSIHTRQILAR
ncbi:MAG: M1 family aminopeptidase, partial [Edaphobacter sp.]